jgi:outer membrane murein-binding lipoprotein Lpp
MAFKTRMALTALLSGTALAGMVPTAAHAQTAREIELETRLKALEAAVQDLRGELNAARATASAAPSSSPAASSPSPLSPSAGSPAIAPTEVVSSPTAPQPTAPQSNGPSTATALAGAKPTPATASTDGFKVAGTTVKLNGFIKTYASVSRYSGGNIAPESVGRDFYYPSMTPVGGRNEGNSVEGHAKQTRLVLSTETPIAGHTLKGLVELDFQVVPGTQGNQRATNGYDLGLRRAFFVYDDWLFGQEWSNFQYTGALPETTDLIGPTEGTVFVRQPQIRYTRKLSDALSLSVAAENPETSSTSVASATIVENADDRLPDVTARLNYKTALGEFSLAGLARKLTIDTGALNESATGWGVSFAGKVPLDEAGRSDIRFMVTHGDGIGRYVGLNLAPDAVFVPLVGMRLQTPSLTAGFAALKLGWTDKLRSTFTGSVQGIDYPTGAVPLGASDSTWSASANLFYSPIKAVDLGVEFRHAERTLVDGEVGKMDRGEFAARYSF